MDVRETSYGVAKRLRFIQSCLDRHQPATVLDIGCGTGSYLTLPLAAANPAVRFTGLDPDAESIRAARQAGAAMAANAVFTDDPDSLDGAFDLVIASEVIEHVDDPVTFLRGLAGRATPDGVVVLTLPNGHGPFERASFAFSLALGALRAMGLLPLFRQGYRRHKRRLFKDDNPLATCSDCPHVNFFSLSGIRRVIGQAGLEVAAFSPRTFLCGPGFDLLGLCPALTRANAALADRLPPNVVSGWMFVLQRKSQAPDESGPAYVRTAYASLRRAVNLWVFSPGA